MKNICISLLCIVFLMSVSYAHDTGHYHMDFGDGAVYQSSYFGEKKSEYIYLIEQGYGGVIENLNQEQKQKILQKIEILLIQYEAQSDIHTLALLIALQEILVFGVKESLKNSFKEPLKNKNFLILSVSIEPSLLWKRREKRSFSELP